MAYSHAERTLAAIQRLEAETTELLDSQDHLDAEQEQWLREAAGQASWPIRASSAMRSQSGQVRIRRRRWRR
jgi:hypothetical protein